MFDLKEKKLKDQKYKRIIKICFKKQGDKMAKRKKAKKKTKKKAKKTKAKKRRRQYLFLTKRPFN